MFDMIRHPILFFRSMFIVASNMTPEQRAEYRSATTERKQEIAFEILDENSHKFA